MGATIGEDAFEFAEDLFVRDDLTWCNIINPRDVNNDGGINPDDVLQLIDALNSGDYSDEVGRAIELDGVPPGFLDVTDDGFIVPRDVLVVINYLNAKEVGVTAAAVPEPELGLMSSVLLLVVVSLIRRRRI